MVKNLSNKEFNAIYSYIDLYMDTLEKFDHGNVIYLREYLEEYYVILIEKKRSKCWVSESLWDKLSDLFSLSFDESKLIISKWVENNYKLKNIKVKIAL